MTIGPIRPSGPQGPNRPSEPVGPKDPAQQPVRAFDVGKAAPLVPAAVGQNNPLDRATFERVARRIKESVSAGKTRPEVIRTLVQDEIRQAFGDSEAGNQSLIDGISERFERDPQLQELMNSLFRSSLS